MIAKKKNLKIHLRLALKNVNIQSFFFNSFRNTIRVSNGLDPDQDCLPRLSANDKSCR